MSGITFIMYAQNPKFRKPNNIKVYVCKNTNGSKQDSHNRQRLPLPEGGEPYVLATELNHDI